MSSEYFLNGTELDDPQGRWKVMEGTLLPDIASPVNVSVKIPGRDGVMPMPTTSFGTSTITIAFMVQDARNGALGGGRAVLDDNFNQLLAALRFRGGLAYLGYRPAGAEWRHASVRLQSISSPVYYHLEKIIETTAVFENVDGVWRSDTEYTLPADDLSRLDGCAMPIFDPLIKLVPTTTRVTVQDRVSGSQITWTGPLRAGKTLVLDPASYWAEWTDGSWGPGTDASAGMSLTSRGFRLTPNSWGRITVTVTGATSAQVKTMKVY